MKIRYWILIFALCLSPSLFLFSEPTTIEISCQKSFYTPDVIRVKKGEPVVLLVKATDVAHGFAIDEFNIAKEVAPGQPVKIEFTPDKAGEFIFYCVVRCGKKHLQMRGRLIVE
ncbi:cupredoxin domain-containing protein [bacterium]|nr:cupredoxin domain-containing protein [bacterium]MCI0606665.1 cupredoxin domain-containing protein [bacterium]